MLGFDYGTVRVGIAITTREQTIASPMQNYNRGSEKGDANFFRQLAEDYRAVGIVVGLPIHLSGGESQKSVESQNWGKWLGEVTGLPVAFYDERFTSSIAEDTLELAGVNRRKQKSRVDMIAAQIMLQMFIDNRKRQSPEEE